VSVASVVCVGTHHTKQLLQQQLSTLTTHTHTHTAGVTCEMLHQRCKLVVGVDSCAELVAEWVCTRLNRPSAGCVQPLPGVMSKHHRAACPLAQVACALPPHSL
jgi:hypothetical protein